MNAVKNNTEDKTIYITEEGFKQLQAELKELKEVERKKVATRLKEAIKLGDLSENSEYQEARTEQSFLEGRILELEEKVKKAKIIKDHKKKSDKVELGTKVTICKAGTKKEEEYTIVGSTEADPLAKKISNESPVGSALMGKKIKEEVSVKTPGGSVKYTIVKLA